MYTLDTANRSLQILLDQVPSAQCTYIVGYVTISREGVPTHQSANGATNSGTAVTMVTAPIAGTKKYVNSIVVHNPNGGTTDVGITIRINDGGTMRNIVVKTLKVAPISPSSLIYEAGYGWATF